MTENEDLLKQHRRAAAFATISRTLQRELDAIGPKYIDESTDKAFATWDVEQWGLYLASSEGKHLGEMMRLRERMGWQEMPEGWPVPSRARPRERVVG